MFKFLSLSVASLFVASSLSANATGLPPMPPGLSDDMSMPTTIELAKGWNALTVPFDGTIQSDVFADVAMKSSSSGKPIIWVMNSSGDNYAGMGSGFTISAGTGFWVRTSEQTTITLSNSNSTSGFDFATKWANTQTYGATWKFMGVSKDTKFADIKSVGITKFYPFKGAYSNWYANGKYDTGFSDESIVLAGTGFWITDK